jgi:LysM repeat protein
LKFLRWFLGFILLMLTVLALQGTRSSDRKEVIQPKYERSTLEGRDFVYYTVQPGDTLEMLQRKFRIPTREAIETLNAGLNNEKLPIHHQIKIPLR